MYKKENNWGPERKDHSKGRESTFTHNTIITTHDNIRDSNYDYIFNICDITHVITHDKTSDNTLVNTGAITYDNTSDNTLYKTRDNNHDNTGPDTHRDT